MKKSTLLILLATFVAAAIFAQEKAQEKKENKKPKATYQVGVARVVVWENKGLDNNTWKSFKVEKNYKNKKGEWKSTSYFEEDELLQLKAALDKAISEESVKTKEGSEGEKK